MTQNAQTLYDELPPERQREFDVLLANDDRRKRLVSEINVAAAQKKFVKSSQLIAALDKYEDNALADFAESLARRKEYTLHELTSKEKRMSDEEKKTLSILANLSLCYANLLDNAYHDMASLLARFGYNPKTTEIFATAGEKMKRLVQDTFGEMPIEWADDFDDACSKADQLVKNKIVSFLRKKKVLVTQKKQKE